MNTPRVNTPSIRYYAKLENSTEEGEENSKIHYYRMGRILPTNGKVKGARWKNFIKSNG